MLARKLIRTLGRYKAQFISMVLMIALGVGVFLGFNIEWYSLEKNTSGIYEATGFADYRIYAETAFSPEDLDAVKAIEGVEDATRYLSVNTAAGEEGDTLALTVVENPRVSGMLLMEGEAYDPESPDGIWLSDRYADANGIRIGDSLSLNYRMISVSGTVRGLVKSSEYLICLPDETQLMPDYSSHGFAFISPVMLDSAVPAMAKLLTGGSLYMQINVKSALDKPSFVKKADEALGRTLLILSKDETISWAEAQGEVNEGKTMGSILPVLFLAIAILTMVTTMHRIAASEKTQIGALKALGFRDRRILVHYTSYALFIGILGSLLGIALGYGLGRFILNPSGAMATYIDLPAWPLFTPAFCWIVILLINLFLTCIGYLSVRRMLRGTAADALRPYTPRRMKHMALEETRAFKSLSFGTKWNLRDLLRHKSRSWMTLFGIAGCMVLLVGGMGMKDTLDAFVDVFFEKAFNYATRINLDTENADNDEALALADQLEADWVAQRSVQIGDRGVSLEIYSVTHDRFRFVDQEMRLTSLQDGGAYISGRIAKEFGLKEGSEMSFSPYGTDEHYTVRVAGILRSLTESVIMTAEYARRQGIPYSITSLFTAETDIEAGPQILNTQSKQSVMDSFGTFIELMDTMVWLLVVAAVALGIVVLYNLGIMSYTERYREMATLKVVGFRNSRIARLLITQNLWLTVLGVIAGLPLGVAVLQYLLTALASEYEMKLTLGPGTYLVSLILTFGVSLAVGAMVARKNRHIDMVAALKTEE